LQLAGGFLAIFHSMDEGDVERMMRHPYAMIETDGDLVGFGVGHPHPRSYGAFPRVLARYVRERKVLSLEEAIRRMTSMPARQFGQWERGLVREGMLADLTVFDAARVQDHATYSEPHRYPTGIVHVVVNGEPVLRGGCNDRRDARTGAARTRALGCRRSEPLMR
jgi:N-acyl-D-amino-acid deacylase